MKFEIGVRVRIAGNHPWAKGVAGHLAEPPDSVRSQAQNNQPWDRGRRIAFGAAGPIVFYWVEFDEPQDDGGGNGPVSGVER